MTDFRCFRPFGCFLAAGLVMYGTGCGAPDDELMMTTETTPDTTTAHEHRWTNKLAASTSPYLLQHAHNPVDWQPWGEAAFAEARRRNVPIFLSVGYATCYWCHVMEREVFENPELVAALNEHFVPVKVDREERPDVDEIYMTATQLLTGSGGWPMNVFLTPPAPEGEQTSGYGLLPYWAATYIPPEAKFGRPGFGEVVEGMRAAWANERAEVLDQATRVADAVRRRAEPAQDASVDEAAVRETVSALRGQYDPEHGGFSGTEGPKFPTPVVTGLLLADAPDTGAQANALRHTFEAMAHGGVYDQVGGGFHRYSVDEKWLVPHFEKMLYDNGQMLSLYAAAYERWQGKRFAGLYARVMRETAEYVLREMRDPSGAFWSAQDAEVNAREGLNYLWTPEQVRAALADEPEDALPGDTAYARTELALQMYGLDRGTNFQDPHHRDDPASNVLHMPVPMSEHVGILGGPEEGAMGRVMEVRAAINAALLKVRDTRDQPITDDKVLAAWNGLAIAGLADAGRVLGEERYVDAAAAAADAVLLSMRDADGGLLRTMRGQVASVPAFLEDYALMAAGLLALDAARPRERRFHAAAVDLMAQAQKRFAAPGGGWFDTLADQSDLFVRSRDVHDGALPSGNAQMIHNYVSLWERAGKKADQAYADHAVAGLRVMAQGLEDRGPAMAHGVHALRRALAHPGLAQGLARPAAQAADTPTGPVSVRVQPDAQSADQWVVTLAIAAGFHVNANPASTPELIATTLHAGDNAQVTVTYPDAVERHLAFADAPLSVYEGVVSLRVTGWAPSAAPLTLRYQACTDEACLAPVQQDIAQPAASF